MDMTLTKMLYDNNIDLWEQAARKPFVTEMAAGTLDKRRFIYYMMQDYLYLGDYIGILKDTQRLSDDEELKAFLSDMKESQTD